MKQFLINLYGGFVYYPVSMISNVLLTYFTNILLSTFKAVRALKVFLTQASASAWSSCSVRVAEEVRESRVVRSGESDVEMPPVSTSFRRPQKCLPAWSARLRWQPSKPICQRDVLLVCDQLLAPISGSLSFPWGRSGKFLQRRQDIPRFTTGCCRKSDQLKLLATFSYVSDWLSVWKLKKPQGEEKNSFSWYYDLHTQ